MNIYPKYKHIQILLTKGTDDISKVIFVFNFKLQHSILIHQYRKPNEMIIIRYYVNNFLYYYLSIDLWFSYNSQLNL